MANRKLGRTSSHRAAMFRNQLASMIDKERITTTLIKAKELRPLIEKMVTLGKTDSVQARRIAAKSLEPGIVQKLFNTLSPRFTERPGGYTRIIKLGPRRGDGTEMAILEFVDYVRAGESAATAPAAKAKKPAASKAPAAKKATAKAAKSGADADDAGKAKSKPAPKKKKKTEE